MRCSHARAGRNATIFSSPFARGGIEWNRGLKIIIVNRETSERLCRVPVDFNARERKGAPDVDISPLDPDARTFRECARSRLAKIRFGSPIEPNPV